LFLTAVQSDQFGHLMAQQMPVVWSVDSGDGTVRSDGVFIASDQSGAAVVRATFGPISNTITLTVSKVTPPVLVPPTNPEVPVPPALPGSNGGDSTILQGGGGSGGSTSVPIEPTSYYAPIPATDDSDWVPDTPEIVTPAIPVPRPDNAPDVRPVDLAPSHPAPVVASAVPAATQPSVKSLAVKAPVQSGPIEITPINRTRIIQEVEHSESDQWNEAMARDARLKLRVGVVSAIGSAAAGTYLLWLIRGGGVLASLFSSAPVWKLVDPLFVLPSPRLYRTIWNRPKKKVRENPEDRFFAKNGLR